MRVALLATGLAMLLPAGAQGAMTVTPTRLDDPTGPGSCPADCSLRQAVTYAGDGGTVNLRTPAAGTIDTYTLSQGRLQISASLRLTGTSPRTTVLQGGHNEPVLALFGGTVNVSGVAITGGTASSGSQGAGVEVLAPSTFTDVTIAGNTAVGSVAGAARYPGNGGGIYNVSTLTLIDSTVTGNRATNGPGDGSSGAGIENAGGTLRLINSTVTGNTADASSGIVAGGGIEQGGGSTSLVNSTVSDNTATGGSLASGGDLYANGGTITAQGTIFARGHGDAGTENCYLSPPSLLTSHGYNLEDRNQCALGTTGDQVGVDPRLGPLGDHGGPTDTLALPVDSPAVDAGNPSGCVDDLGAPLSTDQRGEPRPAGMACDLGAYEGRFPPVNTAPPAVSGTAAPGSTLTCSTGTFTGVSPISYAYRFQRDGSDVQSGSTYGVSAADAGHAIGCVVDARNRDGSVSSASSTVAVPRPSAGPSGAHPRPPGPSLAAFTGVSLLGAHLVARNGRVAVALSCPPAAVRVCSGRITLASAVRTSARRQHPARSRMITIAAGAFAIPSGRKVTLSLKLTRTGRKLLALRTGRPQALRIVIRAGDGAGRRRQNASRGSITLVRPVSRRRSHGR